MNRLSQLTSHFVIATKVMKACPNHNCNCLNEASEFAKAALVLQTKPQIFYPEWRKKNPVFSMVYMKKSAMQFDTEKLFADVDVAARPKCLCSPKLVLRSNDGVTPENPKDIHLIE